MKNNIKKYFENKNRKWIKAAYGHNSSVAKTRFTKALREIEKINPNSICDIGCGDGRLLKSLKNVDRRLGVDNSSTMLKICLQKNDSIKFIKADLNKIHELKQLHREAPFELITMLGVLHYLKNPEMTLLNIKKICNPNKFIMLNFRNRLFNLKEESQYFKSKITLKTKNHLNAEKKFWETNHQKLHNISKILSSPNSKKIIKQIKIQKTQDGVNDLYWNPYGYEYWRQYTPIELILLLDRCGFVPKKIMPLGFSGLKNKPKSALADTTSCLIIVSKT